MAIEGAVATGVPATGSGGGVAGEAASGGGSVATEIEPGTGTPEGTGEGAGEGAEEPAEGEPAGGEEPPPAGEKEGEEKLPGDTGDEFETDGRKIDDKTKKALAAIKKVDPLVAKTLADQYHRTQAIIQDVGAENLSDAVTKVRDMALTFESFGGQEGITNMQEEVTDYRNEITQFAKGDPALIQNLWEANQEGVVLSTVASLDLLAQKAGEVGGKFDQVVIPAMVARLEKAGLYNSLTDLAEHIKNGDGQAAYDLLAKVAKWFGDAKGMQKKQMDLKSARDPEREALAAERAEVAKEKAKVYEDQINHHVNTANNAALKLVVEPFFREMKMELDGKRDFIDGLQSKVWAMLRDDKVFKRNYATIKAKGEAIRAAKYVSDKFAEVLPGVFQSYRNSLYPAYGNVKTIKKVVPTNGVTKPGEKAPVTPIATNGGRPKHSDVSWASDGGKTTDIDWIRGIAFLKNGKKVLFDKNSPPNRLE